MCRLPHKDELRDFETIVYQIKHKGPLESSQLLKMNIGRNTSKQVYACIRKATETGRIYFDKDMKLCYRREK